MNDEKCLGENIQPDPTIEPTRSDNHVITPGGVQGNVIHIGTVAGDLVLGDKISDNEREKNQKKWEEWDARDQKPVHTSYISINYDKENTNLVVDYETTLEKIIRIITREFLAKFHCYIKDTYHIFIAILILILIELDDKTGRILVTVLMFTIPFLYYISHAILLTIRWAAKPHPFPSEGVTKKHILDGFVNSMGYIEKEANINKYGFRLIRHRNDNEPNVQDIDIGIFVNFSQKALHEAHPNFSEQERRCLYERWYKLQPKAFLLLEHLENNNIRVVAISIILPLQPAGRRKLCEGKKSVLELDEEDIVSSENLNNIKHLLIDTWIICPKYRNKYIGYEYGLILKHISYFWKPFNSKNKLKTQVEILVEPDVRSIKRMLTKSDFKPCDQQENIYKLSFPVATADDGTTEHEKNLLNKLKKIQEHISRFATPEVNNEEKN